MLFYCPLSGFDAELFLNGGYPSRCSTRWFMIWVVFHAREDNLVDGMFWDCYGKVSIAEREYTVSMERTSTYILLIRNKVKKMLVR